MATMRLLLCTINAEEVCIGVSSETGVGLHTVTLQNYVMCDCPDFQYRKSNTGEPCKHIAFVLRSVYGINPDSMGCVWAPGAEFARKFREDVIAKRLACVDSCYFCLTTNNAPVKSCTQCKQQVHRSCWNAYLEYQDVDRVAVPCGLCNFALELSPDERQLLGRVAAEKSASIAKSQGLWSQSLGSFSDVAGSSSVDSGEAVASQQENAVGEAANTSRQRYTPQEAERIAEKYSNDIMRITHVCDVGYAFRLYDNNQYDANSTVIRVCAEPNHVADVTESICACYGGLVIEGIDVQVTPFVQLELQGRRRSSNSGCFQGISASRERGHVDKGITCPLELHTNHRVCDHLGAAACLGGYMKRTSSQSPSVVYAVTTKHEIALEQNGLYNAEPMPTNDVVGVILERSVAIDAVLIEVTEGMKVPMRRYDPPPRPSLGWPVYFNGRKTPSAAGKIIAVSVPKSEFYVQRDASLDLRETGSVFTDKGDCGCFWWYEGPERGSRVPIGMHCKGNRVDLAGAVSLATLFGSEHGWGMAWPELCGE
eukprot:Opistho-2@41762